MKIFRSFIKLIIKWVLGSRNNWDHYKSFLNIHPSVIIDQVATIKIFEPLKVGEKYLEIGGHNKNTPIADDLELIIRTFLNTKIIHVKRVL